MSAADIADDVLRVEKGHPGPEELAAVTAVLLARSARSGPAPAQDGRDRAVWRRLERDGGFPLAHSWRSVA
ncbi:acyl-CoA carboxylase subunit epsilon [Streptomyces lavenduligriseus]|uniref:ChlI n=1 Tax=Streptomyces antibioticus TaxID=1890 RepID=Q0R4N8_STRAT|nr:ChlI [Streptomyces antibioticus]WDM16878.1 acyl-CoA carboxylase subunit epsilon [Streptomyces lavenduligriseus]